MYPPYLIIRVRELPPKPWPFTVGSLPLHLTTDPNSNGFEKGHLARGPMVLQEFNLQRETPFSKDVLFRAARHLNEYGPKIRDLFWFGGCWVATTLEETDSKAVPRRIARSPVYFKSAAEDPELDPAALRRKALQGLDYDDTDYLSESNTLLRPGIMLASSLIKGNKNGQTKDEWKSTTSGIMVANDKGEIFITVATHGFENDGLVYHPNPLTGRVIGRVVDVLPGTDISIVKLESGLEYLNETFGTAENPAGDTLSGLAPGFAPHTRTYDMLSMNNPFSGSCDGSILGVGLRLEGSNASYVLHEWLLLDNGEKAPIDGSCGSPVLDNQAGVVGLFRFKKNENNQCICVAATELRNFNYEICGGRHRF